MSTNKGQQSSYQKLVSQNQDSSTQVMKNYSSPDLDLIYQSQNRLQDAKSQNIAFLNHEELVKIRKVQNTQRERRKRGLDVVMEKPRKAKVKEEKIVEEVEVEKAMPLKRKGNGRRKGKQKQKKGK